MVESFKDMRSEVGTVQIITGLYGLSAAREGGNLEL